MSWYLKIYAAPPQPRFETPLPSGDRCKAVAKSGLRLGEFAQIINPGGASWLWCEKPVGGSWRLRWQEGEAPQITLHRLAVEKGRAGL